MSFKVIKKGQYAYKRTGKYATDYRVIFRQHGIHLNEKLLNVLDDRDALRKARDRITQVEQDQARKQLSEDQIIDKSPMVRFESIMDQVIASKAWGPTRSDAEYWLKRVVLPILDKYCPYISEFGPTSGEDFVTWFQNERPGQKVFNARKYFLQVLKRAKKLGLLSSRVDIEIKNPDPKRKKGKVYSDSEIKALFSHASGDLELQMLMAYSMGMRKSEVLKLRWDRLNLERRTIALQTEDTKIRQGREFKVNNTVWERLMDRMRDQTSDYIFPSQKSILAPVTDNKSAWQSCKRKAKVKGRFHDLRHTFLTIEVARKKHQALDVCIYAGLSLEELRQTYLHPTYQDTAYIAESQNEKLDSIISIKKNCNNFCNNTTRGIEYV